MRRSAEKAEGIPTRSEPAIVFSDDACHDQSRSELPVQVPIRKQFPLLWTAQREGLTMRTTLFQTAIHGRDAEEITPHNTGLAPPKKCSPSCAGRETDSAHS